MTRSEKFQAISASSLHRGESTGDTLSFGSRESQTMLRVYDKRLELQPKGREEWQEFGVRWKRAPNVTETRGMLRWAENAS